MLIAQISDLHIGFDGTRADEPNLLRLHRVIDRILALDPAPDLLIASGDLTEHGDAASYRMLADALARLPMPVHLLAGNHDRRAGMAAVFPRLPLAGGYIQQVIDGDTLRLILLDTLEEGRHGGAFCADRAAWLTAALAAAPDRPTLIFLHHPPQSIGIPWMDPVPAEPWIERLGAAIAGHGQIVALAGGHVHRAAHTGWAGLPLVSCPSVAPEVALVLAPLDAARPDARPLIDDGSPGFALHLWRDGRLTTHFAGCRDGTLARFDDRLQPMILAMAAERET